eukprot:7983147-Pyramimonas_sp.AAC.1
MRHPTTASPRGRSEREGSRFGPNSRKTTVLWAALAKVALWGTVSCGPHTLRTVWEQQWHQSVAEMSSAPSGVASGARDEMGSH